MDDHGAMEMLAQAVTVQPSGEADRQKVLMALLTACLFFELDTQPVYIAGRFHCAGSIRCRSSQALKVHVTTLSPWFGILHRSLVPRIVCQPERFMCWMFPISESCPIFDHIHGRGP